MYRRVLAAVAAGCGLILLPLSAGPALAQKRVALVIGNGTYQNVAKLPNPLKDAAAMAAMLQTAGFEWVKTRQDVGNLEFKRALREFMDMAQDADVAVVYYAGHGIQVGDMNYMIPVDAKLATEIDAEDEAVSLDRIVTALEPAKRLRLVILDACRDNPFARLMKRRVATRAAHGGLAKMEPTLGDTLIAYAAKAGSTAEDGEGENSPFAGALLKHLAVPGLDIRLAFGRVRDEVLKSTAYKQEPFVYGSLGGEAIPLVPAPAQPKAPALSDVKGDYELVERIGTKKAWDVFLSTHKEGLYADLARAQLAKLIQAEGARAQPAGAGGSGADLHREPAAPPQPSGPSSEERRAWDRIKDTSDRAKLRDFIVKYPASPLAETAKKRMDSLDRAVQEREEKARAERDAAQRRGLAAKEAVRQAPDEACERDQDRLSRLRGSASQGWAREDLKRLERDTACDRVRSEVVALLAQPPADVAKQAPAPQQAPANAQREATRQRDEEEAKRVQAAEEAERRNAERETLRRRDDKAQLAKSAEPDRKRQDEACERDQDRLSWLRGSVSQGWAREDLNRLERDTACDRVRSEVVALLAQPPADVAKPTPAPQEPPANTPDLVLSAQSELRRLGCYAGREDGNLGGASKEAVQRYLAHKGRSTNEINVTHDLVVDLKGEKQRICPLTCARGERPEGDRCVANTKPRDEDQPRGRTKAKREDPNREAARPKPAKPAARSQAATPRAGGIGVGF
jgi:Caspase domain